MIRSGASSTSPLRLRMSSCVLLGIDKEAGEAMAVPGNLYWMIGQLTSASVGRD